ncbi:AzlD domain-containing protein [Halodesulfovibrio spirochaetisodalis]|uniref:Branched chain amino acid ABC transporter n=1 Tax=Halodesulfovibrio spirochaetisodalis TaxID=1560234 RepID=A0A1B7XI94_9BACT|nr:AzlD domain-containing protein [Halodesulfovibrio spirochaetisodalis]OBQ55225.1 branched chain amino acid ABC transporter [Halodesulfovibrio spirochaetisodalis]
MQYSHEIIFLTIVGMMAVTYIPRLLPIALLSNKQFPEVVTRWLSFVPAAILSALLAPSLFIQDGSLSFSFDNKYLWSSIPVFIVAMRTKSFFGTILTGMIVIAGWRYVLSM